jgi:hypothetical protein
MWEAEHVALGVFELGLVFSFSLLGLDRLQRFARHFTAPEGYELQKELKLATLL